MSLAPSGINNYFNDAGEIIRRTYGGGQKTDEDLLNEGFDRSQREYDLGVARQQRVATGARRELGNSIRDIQNLFHTRLNDILSSVNPEPFSNELRQSLEGQAFSNINNEVGNLTNQVRAGLGQRGLSSGGSQATSAATDIGLGEISARNQARTDLLGQQMDINTAQQRFLANLKAGMTAQEAASVSGLSAVNAQLGLGQASLLDPTYIPNLIGDVTSAQIGIRQSEELLRRMDELIEAGTPDEISRFLTDFLGPLASVSGFSRIGVGLSGLGSIWNK